MGKPSYWLFSASLPPEKPGCELFRRQGHCWPGLVLLCDCLDKVPDCVLLAVLYAKNPQRIHPAKRKGNE